MFPEWDENYLKGYYIDKVNSQTIASFMPLHDLI